MDHQTPQVPVSNKPASSPLDLGKLIRQRTTDLIAIGLVLILGLTVGTQLVEWWRVDQTEVIPGTQQSGLAVHDWNQLNQPVNIKFGDHEIIREYYQGSAKVVYEQILDRCFTYTQSCTIAKTDTADQQEWQKHLSTLTPVRKNQQGCSLYEVKGPFPLLIGVLQPPSPEGVPRIACIASYAEFGPDVWLLTISKGKAATVAPAKGTIPRVPEGCQIGLSLESQSGHGIIQFAGGLSIGQCWQHYDRWATESGMIEENRHVSPEQNGETRVYKTAKEFQDVENVDLSISEPVLKPIPEQDFSSQPSMPMKVIIQIRKNDDRLHGMIHTFPLKNR